MSGHGMFTKRTFGNADNRISLFLMSSAHIQLVVGLLIYFTGGWANINADTMHDKTFRFFSVEHSVMMIAAIILITIGRIRSKRAVDDNYKFRRLFIYSLIALLLIFLAIPWPWSRIARPLF
jgi:hypothetical protein